MATKKQVIEFTADLRKLQQIRRASPHKIDAFGRSVATEITEDIRLSFGVSPSAPGEPPGVDTNSLRGGMWWYPAGRNTWEVSDQVDYGLHLEFGTVHMQPRPFMVPVFLKWEREILTYAKAFNWID